MEAAFRLVGGTSSLACNAAGTLEVGRPHLSAVRPRVSRVHARLSLVTAGSVGMESCGAHPTGVRGGASAEWRWVAKGEACMLWHGDEIALDMTDPAASTLSLECDGNAPPPATDESASTAPAVVDLVGEESDEAEACEDLAEVAGDGARPLKRPRVDGGWCRWGGPAHGPLASWLESARPSQLSTRDCHWIAVDNATPGTPGFGARAGEFDRDAYDAPLAAIARTIEAQGRVSAAAKRECVDAILRTAKANGYTCGKWMVFVQPNEADALWAKVATATASGRLGCSAKIAPAGGVDASATVVCCVYVHDFAARREVRRVLRALQGEIGGSGVEVRAGFKPDVFTMLGITGQTNEWRLETTIYKVAEVLAWRDVDDDSDVATSDEDWVWPQH